MLVPFLVWSIIWYAWNHFILGIPDWSLSGLINGIEQDHIQPVFWFFLLYNSGIYCNAIFIDFSNQRK